MMAFDDTADSVYESRLESHDTGVLSQKSFDEACRLLLRYIQDGSLKGLRFSIRGEVRLSGHEQWFSE